MQLSKVLLCAALAATASIGFANADASAPVAAAPVAAFEVEPPVEAVAVEAPVVAVEDPVVPVAVQAPVAAVEEEPQTGMELVMAKAAAFEEAEDFQVGDPIIASAELVVTEESPDPEVVEIAMDPDFIAEEMKPCCPEGSFCCGLELGCIPDALAPDVMCPVLGPDSPVPCCTRKLF